MEDKASTVGKRPLPRRPKYGWDAWLATMGYIRTEYSPDATLKLEAYPVQGADPVCWAGTVTWDVNSERVADRHSIVEALRDLWGQVEAHYSLFQSAEAAIRRPANYADDLWFDEYTSQTMDRLVHLTQTVFHADWLVIFMYQPIEMPDMRVQARLLADDNRVRLGGHGPALSDACSDLYHHAAPVFAAYKRRS